jgi:hypothetical protein
VLFGGRTGGVVRTGRGGIVGKLLVGILVVRENIVQVVPAAGATRLARGATRLPAGLLDRAAAAAQAHPGRDELSQKRQNDNELRRHEASPLEDPASITLPEKPVNLTEVLPAWFEIGNRRRDR